MPTGTEHHPERFNVDTAGMRQLHQKRNPAQLVKELIQNSFDEDAGECSVNIMVELEGVRVIVEDDGPGFRDIRDAYTLMGDTPKRMNPEARGRFNMGEKEVLSVARWARIETAGATVEFPETGGRTVRENSRRRGTRITAMMPWGNDEAVRLAEGLATFRPPEGIAFTVNGLEVPRAEPVRIHSAVLETVIQDEPGQPLRPTRRKTAIHILPQRGGVSRIFEMGIPIQEIESPFSVDIMQKVPMPPNRDTVSESYLNRVYTEVLNATHDILLEDDFGENWIRTAVEHRAIGEGAVKQVIRGRYGEKVVTWSSNQDANMKATDAGYEVVHPRSLGKEEIKNMRSLGGLQSANDVFGRKGADNPEVITPEEVQKRFAEWVRGLGALAGKEVTPVFIRDEDSNEIASCTMNTDNPVMRLNTHHLDTEFFMGRGEEQLDLIIHELGHAEMDGKMSHGPKWGEACCRVAARIALGMAK